MNKVNKSYNLIVIPFQIKLCELEDAELIDRRGYLVLSFTLAKEGKVYLRRTEGIRDWFNALKVGTLLFVQNYFHFSLILYLWNWN